jgi:DNA end-binding protein Ku
MARAMWSGIISFGMVSIPIKLYKATDEKGVAFNQLHSVCHSRIQEKRWCSVCEREVAWDEIVKGYQYARDQFVVLSPDDLKNLPLPAKEVIQVNAFVSDEEIDPLFFNNSYYVEPDKRSAKAYVLLLKSLTDKGKLALGTIALRNKEQLCTLRPHGKSLLLETLLYPDEIREDQTIVPAAEPTQQELTMAASLIDLMTQKFEPEKYADHYREVLETVIESKLEGREVVTQPARPTGKVVDLMETLKASLEQAKAGKGRATKAANAGSKSGGKLASKRASGKKKTTHKGAA